MQQPSYTHETHPDIKRATAPHEFTERAKLLDTVTIDSYGVAHCTHPLSDVVTSVAAIQVDSSNHAKLLGFEQMEDGVIFRPRGAAARIGFFIGHAGDREVNTVLRVGAYPGYPIVLTEDGTHPQEIMIGLHGIKPTEKHELQWAEDTGLYDRLGFHEHSSRGVCNRVLQQPSRAWQRVPLSLENDTPQIYQVLGYETEELQPTIDSSTVRTCRMTLGKLSIKSLQAAFEFTAMSV